MNTEKGVYLRKDGRWEARYKRPGPGNGKPVYTSVYGDTREEAIEKRRQASGAPGSPSVFSLPTELNLLILGAGSHGRNIREIAESLRIFKRISFLDDFTAGEGILGKCSEAARFRREYACAFIAIGDNEIRRKYSEELKAAGFMMPNIISPAATLSPKVSLGEGIAILPRSTVNEAEIGDFCILASNSLVNNGVKLGAFSHVDCGGIVLKNSVVEEGTTVESGSIFS